MQTRERLNEKFGELGWDLEVEEPWQAYREKDEDRGPYTCRAKIKVFHKVGEGQYLNVTRQAVGVGTDGLAAEQDAFNRAAALFLGEDNGKSEPARESVGQTESPQASPGSPVSPEVQPGPSRETINKSISAHSQIILAKKLRTQDQLVKMVQAYGVSRKEELTQEQALKLLEQLTILTNEGQKSETKEK